MPRIDVGNSSRTFTLTLVIAVVAMLYLAQQVLIPFALAILLTFLLAPLVVRLERWHLGRVPSVMLVVALAFVTVSGLIWIVSDQAISVAQRSEELIDKLQSKERSGPLGRLRDRLQRFSDRMANPRSAPGQHTKEIEPQPQAATVVTSRQQDPQSAAPDATRQEPVQNVPPHLGVQRANAPVPVQIVEPALFPWTTLSAWAPGILGLLANGGVVTLFVVFMLIEREDLRNRLIRLIGPSQISTTTQALDDAAKRVSKYLRAQLIVNASYGLALAIGLFLIGVPNAPLWGLVAGLLRYIPYAGPWIAAICPIMIALVTFETWTGPLLTLGLFIALELISNNVLEPILYRSSTGISTIGILVAAVFWTWLWGAVGLVLATPLTVCIAVMGRYVRQLEFLNTLLSDEPVLSPGAQYYQRLLAGDQDEADSLIERQVVASSVEELCGDLLMPALAFAEQDRHNGLLSEEKQAYILGAIREVVDGLAERAPVAAPSENGHPEVAAVPHSERSVICLPARDEADELAAEMLSQLLTRHDHLSQSVSVKALASEMLEQVDESQVGTVCVSAIPPFAISHARYLCKRLRSRFPSLKIVMGLWQQDELSKKTYERLQGSCADKVVTSLAQALKEI